MSNSNSNNDKDYSGFLDYLSSEHLVGSSVLLTIFVFSIIISSMSTENKGFYIKTSIGLNILVISIYMGYQYNKYSDILSQKQKELDMVNRVKSEAALEADSFCQMNPDICMHDGKCQNIGSDLQGYRCNCTAGWIGKNCNTPDEHNNSSDDIDFRCDDPVTGEKKPGLEWCNTNFDGKGGKCVDSMRYTIDCPVNQDGSANFKYNEYGCDVDNEEVWCPESNVDGQGKCVVRTTGTIGEPCNARTISQDCGGRRCLDWDNGKKTCVANNDNNKVYNAKLDKCIEYDCSKYNASETCNKAFYCKYANGKCKVRPMKEHCQSKDSDRCEDDVNCVFDDSHGICHDKKSGLSVGGDCSSYSNYQKMCNNALEDCKYENNMCKTNVNKQLALDNDLNSTGTIIVPPVTGPAPVTGPVVPVTGPAPVTGPVVPVQTPANQVDSFTVGGRIKNDSFKVNEGYVVGGYSEI